ncbi:hypothetical protein IQ06DRAFT_80033 [Phaeosphaeriaceae sp. SRC1lsM3a]|nr:hypothetical protein IQ06DRAFT_80033 [Stagonospora sp. SRC1lsM3a]
MARPHLLGLPRELRDIILQDVVPERLRLVHSTYEDNVDFLNHNGIMLANRQLRNETIDTVYRRSTTTIILSRKSRIPLLRTRRRISPSLKRNKYVDDGISFMRIIRCMPALREIVCEIRWTPCVTASVLLPDARESMLREFKRVTIKGEAVPGWELEDRVVDSTRWMKNWSGLLIARKI